MPADATTGITYQADAATLLCEIEWWDEPKAGQITMLMEAAADALDMLADQDA